MSITSTTGDAQGPVTIPVPPQSVIAMTAFVGMRIKYVGTASGGGTVTVAADKMTLKQGAVGSATADATIQLGSGSAAGEIIWGTASVSDKWGLIADHINKSANWKCMLVDLLRNDAAPVTTGVLATLSETQAKVDTGVGLLRSGTVALAANTFAWGIRLGNKDLDGNSDKGIRNAITEITAEFTFTTAGTFAGVKVYQVNDKEDPAVAPTALRAWPEASTTPDTLNSVDFGDMNLYSRPGYSLVVRFENTGGTASVPSMAATDLGLTVTGYREQIGCGGTDRGYRSDQ